MFKALAVLCQESLFWQNYRGSWCALW